jgi:hypothetical protein
MAATLQDEAGGATFDPSALIAADAAEQAARIAADNAEATARGAGDTAEASARAAAVTAEASTRAAADVDFDARLDTVEATLPAKADLVGGVVPSSQIPALAIGQTVTVASQVAMLALTTAQVQPGDVAIRTDLSGHRFLLTGTNPATLGNWIALETPDAVSSVNGQQGSVTLGAVDVGATPAAHATDTANPHSVTKSQVGLGSVDNTADTAKPVSTAQQTALDLKSDKADRQIAVLTADAAAINSSTTFTNMGLALALGSSATEMWLVKFWLFIFTANSTMDAKMKFTFPTGCTIRWGPITGSSQGWGAVATGTAPAGAALVQTDQKIFGTAAADIAPIPIVAVVYGGGTAGNVQLQYSQNTSDAGTLRALKGSVMEAQRIAT